MKKENTFDSLEELIAIYPKIALGKAEDISGEKFGRLTPLFRVEKKDTYWACKCDCGKYIICRANHLTSMSIQSCGCYFRENSSKIDKKWKPNHEDLTNRKFGYLAPLEMVGRDNTGKAVWDCLCDCGKRVKVSASHLKTGHTQSCGCKRTSQYEERVEKWLKNNNLTYKKEVKVKELGLLRFDFQVFYNNIFCFIEVQGQQHYIPNSLFGGEQAFYHLEQNDKKKKEYCSKNNIPFLEIKYSDNFEDKLNNFFQLKSSTTIPKGSRRKRVEMEGLKSKI